MPRWGTIQDLAAERLISTKTVRRAIARGDVYAERLGPRLIRVDLDSFKGRPLAYTGAAALFSSGSAPPLPFGHSASGEATRAKSAEAHGANA